MTCSRFHVCSTILIAVFLAMPARAQSNRDQEQETEPKTLRVGMITLKGAIPEGNTPASAFGADDGNLLGTIKRLRKAAQDSKIEAVVLRLRNPGVGRGTVHELQTAIDALRKSGKKVWAQIEFASTADYMIACACDKIIMPESGYMLLPGTRAEVMFYRNLFDKLEREPVDMRSHVRFRHFRRSEARFDSLLVNSVILRDPAIWRPLNGTLRIMADVFTANSECTMPS